MQEQDCHNCQKTFRDYASNHRKYCSYSCKSEAQIKDRTLVCGVCSIEFKPKHYNKDKYCSKSCISIGISKNKMGQQAWNRGKRYLQISGENHWNWKGGNLRGKRGAGQRRFRKAVLERDNHKCVMCGALDKPLVADHIKPWAEYPELREVVDNGRTLCKDCNYESTYIKREWAING